MWREQLAGMAGSFYHGGLRDQTRSNSQAWRQVSLSDMAKLPKFKAAPFS